jgi:hypothetical protein
LVLPSLEWVITGLNCRGGNEITRSSALQASPEPVQPSHSALFMHKAADEEAS